MIRYDLGASDVLELPQGQSLENQDAEEQPVEPVHLSSTLVRENLSPSLQVVSTTMRGAL